MANILIIDDQDTYLELCERHLPEHSFVPPARNFREAGERLRTSPEPIDLVLLDVHFNIEDAELLPADKSHLKGAPGDVTERLRRTQGFKILEALRPVYPDLPVIVMTSVEDLPIGLDAERLDAEDYTYLLDDEYLDARALRVQVQSILAQREDTREDETFYWGTTRVMRSLRQRLSVLARGQLPLILTGPTGSGKSLLAREHIHRRSGRSGDFVAVDLSTLPESLMAAHLFGVVKGAYTGATANREGVIERAQGGTLFLDEIGNLSLELQKSLLLVLQDHTYRPVGSVEEHSSDVKLVVATNEDLGLMVREGRFREDLLMRLNPATAVRLPSLRDRKDDFEDLLGYFLRRVCAHGYNKDLLDQYARRHGLSREESGIGVAVVTQKSGAVQDGRLTFLLHKSSAALLRVFDWPGNFRQLEMVLSNLVTFTLVSLVEDSGGSSPAPPHNPAARTDVVPFPVKTVVELLRGFSVEEEPAGEEEGGVQVFVRPHDTLNGVSCDVERQYLEHLYLKLNGDLEGMAALLLEDASAGRKVQLRMNQLGIRLRMLQRRVRS
jgi:DNA-binding NtrC family response regulator